MAARAQEGLEELSHVEGKEGQWEEIPLIQGKEQWLGGATSPPRSGGCAAQEGLEEPSHVEGQEGQWEEIPLIKGKEQRLCFDGATVKRYSTPKEW